MNGSPISALAAHHQPRPRLPLSEARQGNNIPLAPQPKPKQQHPLATEMQQAQHEPERRVQEKEKQKQIPEPKKEKVRPPSPPAIIRDSARTLLFSKVGFLGEGGFARVYECKDAKDVRYAIKVISKSALKTTKNRTKLFAEIKIHKSLQHPNIVKFEECFEDEENVYMVLELCEGGSLVDLIRRRKRLTEPEARVLMIQLIGASEWMHAHQVIHRDLKLGNIFLDAQMNVKVGDFGLAALIENPGERKKTVCGTPNYIAPEVLFDPGNGHSFEVDIWSIGVILYTLIVGKPPFQNKEIKAIYKRIRDNIYEFPPELPISQECKSLISAMLTKDPAQRPNLREVLEHPFFTEGLVPTAIPSSAHEVVPSYRNLTLATSRKNLQTLREAALLGDEAQEAEEQAAASEPQVPTPSAAQTEREFQQAIQPGSPISVLLKSAKQPLLVAPRDTENLIKRLTASRERQAGGPMIAKRSQLALKNIKEGQESEKEVPIASTSKKQAKDQGSRITAVENQKARIVAQMAATLPSTSPIVTEDAAKEKALKRSSVMSTLANPVATAASGGPEQAVKLNTFNAAELTLAAAFTSISNGTTFQPSQTFESIPQMPNFLICWVDYSSKYGMGYALSDGTIAAHFNDSTSLILSPNEKHIEYIVRRGKGGATYVRKHYNFSERPEELGDKTKLLGHFSSYLMQKLYGEHEYTFVDLERTNGLDFVQKYLRLKHAILFKLSNDVLQFNFYDHTKIILSHRGHVVAHLDKEDVLTQYMLEDLVLESSTPEGKRIHDKLLTKLKYCRQVLREIRKGEVVLVKPVVTASTPIPQLESPPLGSTDNEDAASSGPRIEDIGKRERQRTTSLKSSRTQLR